MPTSSCVCALCLPSRLLHAIRCFLGCVRARRSPHLRTVRAAPLELQVPACIPACAQRPSARTQVYNRAQSSANPTGNVQYYPVVAVLGAQSLFESGPQTDESERINLSPAVQLQDEICFHAMQDKKADTLDASCRTVCTRLQARLLHARALWRHDFSMCTAIESARQRRITTCCDLQLLTCDCQTRLSSITSSVLSRGARVSVTLLCPDWRGQHSVARNGPRQSAVPLHRRGRAAVRWLQAD